jgi:hypothetical protein
MMVAKGDVRYGGFERLEFIQTCSNCDIWEDAELKLMFLS